VQFEHLILATGSQPTKIPSLSIDSPRMMDSTSALDLPDVPQSLLVIGGGYIGLELGTVYATLGSKVSVVEMTPGLLPGADRDLVGVLEKRLKGLFASIMLNTKVVKVIEDGAGIRVTFEGKDGGSGGPSGPPEQLFDRVLVAVGRRPNSNVPGLDTTHVKVDAKGFIETDLQRRTGSRRSSRSATSPASRCSHTRRRTKRVWRWKPLPDTRASSNRRPFPAVVFTDPEIAVVRSDGNAGAGRRRRLRGREVSVGRVEPGDHRRSAGRADEADRRKGHRRILGVRSGGLRSR
jgi:dihydrolipoamide dehydrogenase